jgi:tetratricopeptide (TPR) repeat protein
MMKKVNLVLMAAMAAIGLAGVTGGSLLLVSPAHAAAKEKDKAEAAKPKLSPAVAKPLVAAQAAMNAKNWDEALARVAEAAAVEPKTPYDAFMIDEMGWYVYLQKKDYPKAAESLERALGSGMVAPADRPQRLRALTQLNIQNKQYPKALQFGDEYLTLNPGDTEIALLLAQTRYLTGDIAGAKAAAEKITLASPKPPEQALLVALRSNYELKDTAGVMRALEMLVRFYPQKKYWEDLLNNQLFRTKDDRGLRALYRLMSDTDTLDKSDEYAEMGSTLITGGYPNEAKQILERGMSANVFQGTAKARAQADLERARAGAALDAKELPSAATQLAGAKTPQQMLGIGKLYFSSGEYEKSVDALRKGLAKGGLKPEDADDANLLIGIASARLGKAADANAAFDAVKNASLAEVARLWKLKVEAPAAPTPAAG